MRMAIALVLMTGCMCDGERVVTPTDRHELVERAAREWTDIGCPIRVGDDGALVVFVTKQDRPDVVGGYFDGSDIYIRAETSDALAHALLLHEMGHMLGYKHRDHGIMRAEVSLSVLTADDCQH